MTGFVHRELADGRWGTLSLAEQLGNIGSEVSRALNWRERNPELVQRSLDRALELFHLTLDDPRHRASLARLREICRAREVLLDYVAGPNQFGSTDATIRRYYDVFACAATLLKR